MCAGRSVASDKKSPYPCGPGAGCRRTGCSRPCRGALATGPRVGGPA